MSTPVVSHVCGLPLLLTAANQLGLPMPCHVTVDGYHATLSLSSPAEVEAWAEYLGQPVKVAETPSGTLRQAKATVFDLPLLVLHVELVEVTC